MGILMGMLMGMLVGMLMGHADLYSVTVKSQAQSYVQVHIIFGFKYISHLLHSEMMLLTCGSTCASSDIYLFTYYLFLPSSN